MLTLLHMELPSCTSYEPSRYKVQRAYHSVCKERGALELLPDIWCLPVRPMPVGLRTHASLPRLHSASGAAPNRALAHPSSLTADLRQTPRGRRAPQAPPWICASSSSAARRRWWRSGACWSMCAPARLRCAPAGGLLILTLVTGCGRDLLPCCTPRPKVKPDALACCTTQGSSPCRSSAVRRLPGPGRSAHVVVRTSRELDACDKKQAPALHSCRHHCEHADVHVIDHCQLSAAQQPVPQSQVPSLPAPALSKA